MKYHSIDIFLDTTLSTSIKSTNRKKSQLQVEKNPTISLKTVDLNFPTEEYHLPFTLPNTEILNHMARNIFLLEIF